MNQSLSKKRIGIILNENIAHLPPLQFLVLEFSKMGISVDIFHVHDKYLGKHLEVFSKYKNIVLNPIKVVIPEKLKNLDSKYQKKIKSLLFFFQAMRSAYKNDCSVLIGVNHHAFAVAALLSGFGFFCPLIYIQYEFFLQSEWNSPYNWFETVFLHFANAVVSVEPNRANLLKVKAKLRQDPFVILNTPPVNVASLKIMGCDVREWLREYGINPSHVVIYQGSLHPVNCYEELIASTRNWDTGIILVIFGYETENHLQNLTSLINRLQVGDRVFIHAPVSFEKLMSYTASSDAGVVFWVGDTTNIMFASPGKTFQYLSAGIPIIGSRNPLLIDVIEKNNIGYCVDPREPDNIAGAVNLLFSDRVAFLEMSTNARTQFELTYNFQIQSKKFLDYIDCLVK